MNKYQSIISAAISAIIIFVLPYVNKHGFVIDEVTAEQILIGVVGFIAFLWSCWKDHNMTDAALEAHLIMKELKNGEDELDDVEEYEEIEEGDE
ncbi:MAG: SPP1 phage holin family protein [Lachnospiraceae bacterium]|nr:SPP1 phage holin family protein [Lachnospiraceae bacterium]